MSKLTKEQTSLRIIKATQNKWGFCVLPGFKRCSSCKEILLLDNFYKKEKSYDGHQGNCKKCKCTYLKSVRLKNGSIPMRIPKETSIFFRECYHCDQVLPIDFFHKNAVKTNCRKCAKCSNRITKQKKSKDYHYRLICALRTSISCRINAIEDQKKLESSEQLLGCSFAFFQNHIESKFDIHMNWNNYGSLWQLDHIIPCSLFNCSTLEMQKIIFNYRNLQPLTKSDNITKNDKLPNGQQARNIPRISSKEEFILIGPWLGLNCSWVKNINFKSEDKKEFIIKKRTEISAKNFTIVNPLGETINITNMKKFCKDNHLHMGSMYAVANKKKKSYKGWSQFHEN